MIDPAVVRTTDTALGVTRMTGVAGMTRTADTVEIGELIAKSAGGIPEDDPLLVTDSALHADRLKGAAGGIAGLGPGQKMQRTLR